MIRSNLIIHFSLLLGESRNTLSQTLLLLLLSLFQKYTKKMTKQLALNKLSSLSSQKGLFECHFKVKKRKSHINYPKKIPIQLLKLSTSHNIL